jgi:hypothetical protein
MAARFATTTSDHGHVVAIATHGLATLAACIARFIGIEFVRGALGVSGLAAFARDLALLAAIHRREATIAASTGAALHVAARVASLFALPVAVDRSIIAIVVA